MKTFKIFLTIFFAVLATASCGLQNKKESVSELYAVPSGRHGDYATEKYKDKDGQPVSGYINRDGQMVIKLEFSYADDFHQGLARVLIEKKGWGYINQKGEFVIKPQFWVPNNFQLVDGRPLASVKFGNKWGFIDNSGNYVINPQFDEVGSFTQSLSSPTASARGLIRELAKVKVGGKWGFIDGLGNYVVNPQYDAAGNFSEGLALVKVGDKCGYIDVSGNTVIEPQFSCTMSNSILEPDSIIDPGNFSSWRMKFVSLSLARVINRPIQAGKPRVIKSGSFWSFSSNGAATSKYGYIDRTGKYVIEPQFDEAKDFTDDGLAAVGFAQNMTVLYDVPINITETTGDEERDKAIQEEENRKPPTKEGVMRVVKWGVINETGRFVINPLFDKIENFSEGLAAVTVGGLCGYIDKSGKYIIEPKFSNCDSFNKGVAYVKSPKYERFIIDKSGKIIFTYYSQNRD